MPTPLTTLWSQRHQHWLRHLERTNIPAFRFERPNGPPLRVLPDWSRPLPVAPNVSEWKHAALAEFIPSPRNFRTPRV